MYIIQSYVPQKKNVEVLRSYYIIYVRLDPVFLFIFSHHFVLIITRFDLAIKFLPLQLFI